MKKAGGLPLLDGGVEGHALISSCNSTKSQLAIERKDAGTYHKKISHVHRQSKKLQQDSRRDTSTIKSYPTPAGWVTHKLEDNNTKEVLPLL